VVLEERIVGAAGNRTIADCDPTAHAEIIALRAQASAVGNYRLTGGRSLCDDRALRDVRWRRVVQARIARLIYGADDASGLWLMSHLHGGCWMRARSIIASRLPPEFLPTNPLRCCTIFFAARRGDAQTVRKSKALTRRAQRSQRRIRRD